MILNSEIPSILKKYDFSVEDAISLEKFSLLESEVPNLCADRVDYAIREFHYWACPELVRPCVDALRTYNGEIVFANKESARIFALEYMNLNDSHWSHPSWQLRYKIFAGVLRTGLNREIITLDDFSTDDETVINKLKASGILAIESGLDMLRKKEIHYVETDRQDPEGILLEKKFRWVDPKFMLGEKTKTFGEEERDYIKCIEKKKKINEDGTYVRLVQ